MKTKTLFFLAGAFFLLGILLIILSPEKGCPATLKLGGEEFKIECAVTDAERELGLSNRESLASSTGMLFVFEKPGRYGFWMKDMKFPLDMIWLDAEKRVVYIKEDARPESYPSSFGPTSLTKYVLEVNSGDSLRLGIKAGDIARF